MASPIDDFAFLSGQVDLTEAKARPGANDEEALRQFEGLVLRLLLKEMRKSMSGEGLFGQEGAMYQEWFDDEITQRIAGAGGLGLASRLDLSGLQHVSPVSNGEGLHALFPAGGQLSSGYGGRSDPLSGQHREHNGIDIAAGEGSPIWAVRAGTVTLARKIEGYGNVVFVDHGDGLQTRYAHCKTLNVHKGDRVNAGTMVGSVGSTGRSTGPHLHFEVRQDGKPVDPSSVFRWEHKP